MRRRDESGASTPPREVPASVTLEGCWELVETAEATRRHCVMMENCCYGRPELMALNMVRQGLLGELIHGECGYLHDLREGYFATAGRGVWWRAEALKHNGNLYPTHGLGPLAQCMNINRGDIFDFIVSMSSRSRGLNLYSAEHLDKKRSPAQAGIPPGRYERQPDPHQKRLHNHRDLRLLQSAPLQPDQPAPGDQGDPLRLPRPGLPRGPQREEGRMGTGRKNIIPSSTIRFGKPWARKPTATITAEWISWRITGWVQCLLRGEPTDMNVYDAAALSAVCELSERSAAPTQPADRFPGLYARTLEKPIRRWGSSRGERWCAGVPPA